MFIPFSSWTWNITLNKFRQWKDPKSKTGWVFRNGLTIDQIREFCLRPDGRILPGRFDGAFNDRKESHFLDSHVVGIDIDESPSLAAVLTWLASKSLVFILWTSKSHQKQKGESAPCDRFHALLGLSRTVSATEYSTLVCWLQTIPELKGIDGASKKVNEVLSGGLPTSDFFSNETGQVLDVDSILKVVLPITTKKNAGKVVSGTDSEWDGWIAEHQQEYAAILSEVSRLWGKWGKKTTDGYVQLYQVILVMTNILHFASDSLVYRALVDNATVGEWLVRHPNQQGGILKKAIEKARSENYEKKRGLFHFTHPEMMMEDVELKGNKLWSVEECLSRLGRRDGVIDRRLVSFIDQGLEDSKVMIVTPCGTGKTTCATIYVHKTDRKFVIGKETVEGMHEQQKDLLTLGTESAVLRSWRAETCPNAAGHTFRDFLGKTALCHQCVQKCDYYKTAFELKEQLKQRVVFVTHKRLWTMLETGQLGDRDIIVDEMPMMFTSFELNIEEAKERLQRLFGSTYDKDLSAMKHILDGICQFKGTAEFIQVDKFGDRTRWMSKAMKNLFLKIGNGLIVDDDVEWMVECARFFRHSHGKIVVIRPEGGRYLLKAESFELNGEHKNRMVLLTASGIFCLRPFLGFKKFEIPPDMSYARTTVKTYRSNATSEGLSRHWDAWKDMWLKVIPDGSQVFIATNKTGVVLERAEELKKDLLAKHCSVFIGLHGSIVGSNTWRNCDVSVLPLGIFKGIHDAMLTAHLVFGEPILYSDAFRDDGSPAMHGGFVDEKLSFIADREITDTIYQYSLRGILRSNPDADAVLILPVANATILHFLARLLPGASFDSCDGKSSAATKAAVELRRKNIDELGTLTVCGLLNEMGCKTNKKSDRKDIGTLIHLEYLERSMARPQKLSEYVVDVQIDNTTLCPPGWEAWVDRKAKDLAQHCACLDSGKSIGVRISTSPKTRIPLLR